MNSDRLLRFVKTVVYWYLHRSTRKLVFLALMGIAGGFLAPSIKTFVLIYFLNDYNVEQTTTILDIIMPIIGTIFVLLALAELIYIGPFFEKKANRHRNMIDAFKKYLSYCDKNKFISEMDLIQDRLYVTDDQYNMVRGWTALGRNVKGCFVKQQYEDQVLKFHKALHAFNNFCDSDLHDYKNDGCNHVIRDADFVQRKDKLLQLTDELKKDLNELHGLFKYLDNMVLLAF